MSVYNPSKKVDQRTVFSLHYLLPLTLGLVFGFLMADFFIYSISLRPDWLLYVSRQQHFDSVKGSIESENSLEKSAYIHQHASENNTVATKLYGEVRVLCWILTHPKHHETAVHIKRTWGKRCNKLVFMSTAEDEELNSIPLNVTGYRNNTWPKTKEALKYIYENHIDDADWFFKVGHNTYAILENLRFLLYPYSPQTAIYFGARSKYDTKKVYKSNEAAYVLSKEALHRLVTDAIPEPRSCNQNATGIEDVDLGKCLEMANVIAGDSTDVQGFTTFVGVRPAYPKLETNRKLWRFITSAVGFDSNKAIVFHYLSNKQMYVMDYIIYHLKLYGTVEILEELPEKLQPGEMFSFEPTLDNAVIT